MTRDFAAMERAEGANAREIAIVNRMLENRYTGCYGHKGYYEHRP